MSSLQQACQVTLSATAAPMPVMLITLALGFALLLAVLLPRPGRTRDSSLAAAAKAARPDPRVLASKAVDLKTSGASAETHQEAQEECPGLRGPHALQPAGESDGADTPSAADDYEASPFDTAAAAASSSTSSGNAARSTARRAGRDSSARPCGASGAGGAGTSAELRQQQPQEEHQQQPTQQRPEPYQPHQNQPQQPRQLGSSTSSASAWEVPAGGEGDLDSATLLGLALGPGQASAADHDSTRLMGHGTVCRTNRTASSVLASRRHAVHGAAGMPFEYSICSAFRDGEGSAVGGIQSFPTDEWQLRRRAAPAHAAQAAAAPAGVAAAAGRGGAAVLDEARGTSAAAASGAAGTAAAHGAFARQSRWRPPGLSYFGLASTPPSGASLRCSADSNVPTAGGAELAGGGDDASTPAAAGSGHAAAPSWLGSDRGLPTPLDTPLLWRKGAAWGGQAAHSMMSGNPPSLSPACTAGSDWPSTASQRTAASASLQYRSGSSGDLLSPVPMADGKAAPAQPSGPAVEPSASAVPALGWCPRPPPPAQQPLVAFSDPTDAGAGVLYDNATPPARLQHPSFLSYHCEVRMSPGGEDAVGTLLWSPLGHPRHFAAATAVPAQEGQVGGGCAAAATTATTATATDEAGGPFTPAAPLPPPPTEATALDPTAAGPSAPGGSVAPAAAAATAAAAAAALPSEPSADLQARPPPGRAATALGSAPPALGPTRLSDLGRTPGQALLEAAAQASVLSVVSQLSAHATGTSLPLSDGSRADCIGNTSGSQAAVRRRSGGGATRSSAGGGSRGSLLLSAGSPKWSYVGTGTSSTVAATIGEETEGSGEEEEAHRRDGSGGGDGGAAVTAAAAFASGVDTESSSDMVTSDTDSGSGSGRNHLHIEADAAAPVGSRTTLYGGSAAASPFLTHPIAPSGVQLPGYCQRRGGVQHQGGMLAAAADAAGAAAGAAGGGHIGAHGGDMRYGADTAAPSGQGRSARGITLNLGDILNAAASHRDPAGSAASAGAAARGSVLYTSRCNSKVLSVKLEGAAAEAAIAGASGDSPSVASGVISRRVASTLLRRVPPGHLVRISALAVRGCVQLLVHLQLGPPLLPVPPQGLPLHLLGQGPTEVTTVEGRMDLAAALMAELSGLVSEPGEALGPPPRSVRRRPHQRRRGGGDSSGGLQEEGGQRSPGATAEESEEEDEEAEEARRGGGGGRDMAVTMCLEWSNERDHPTVRSFTTAPALAGGESSGQANGPAPPVPAPPVAAPAASTRHGPAGLSGLRVGKPPAGPAEGPEHSSSEGPDEAASCAAAGGGGEGEGAQGWLPPGWREVGGAANGQGAAAGVATAAAVPVPAVLATAAEGAPRAGGSGAGGAVRTVVRVELLYDAAAVDESGAEEAEAAAAATARRPSALRVVVSAGGRVLLDDVYDTHGLPYIDIALEPDSIAGLLPSPLNVWLLAAPKDPWVAGGGTTHTQLVANAGMLLLPPAAAAELQTHINSVLSDADGTAEPVRHGEDSVDGAVKSSDCGSGACRRSLWAHHLQPLLSDLGYVLAAQLELRSWMGRRVGETDPWFCGADADDDAPAGTHGAGDGDGGPTDVAAAVPADASGNADVGITTAMAALAAWSELAEDLLTHFEAAGLVACWDLLARMVDGGVAAANATATPVATPAVAAAAAAAQGTEGGGRSLPLPEEGGGGLAGDTGLGATAAA